MEMKMEVAEVLHMNGGEEEVSYATNSSVQNCHLQDNSEETWVPKKLNLMGIHHNHQLIPTSCTEFKCSSGCHTSNLESRSLNYLLNRNKNFERELLSDYLVDAQLLLLTELHSAIDLIHYSGWGSGDSSSRGSSIRREVISMTKPIRKQAIIDALWKTDYPKTFCFADLGCSTGPNSLLLVSEILETIHKTCEKLGKQTPECQVYLNDLPKNDFNNIFMSLPSFQARMRGRIGPGFGPCFVVGVPGSFYGRLFPRESLHFVHSSYSLMWLSQVPTLTEINRRRISLATTSPSSVIEAYYQQFQKDFCSFLNCRSQEVADGGRMVLTILGRASDDPTSKEGSLIWELLSIALNEMVDEGLINGEKIDFFNIPQYTPSQGEVKALVEKEGSFCVDRLETSKVNWNACGRGPSLSNNLKNDGYSVARCIRAVAEPLLSSMFEKSVIDEVFRRYSGIIVDHMGKETGEFCNVTISMTKVI